MDESLAVATALGQGGWLSSALFRLFLSQVAQEGLMAQLCQLLLGYEKLLNHAGSEAGKSCLCSASTVTHRGNPIAKFSATGKEG